MSRLAHWCFLHRRLVVALWLVLLVATVAADRSLGSKYNESASLPGTDAQAAVTLLTDNFPAASGESDQIVIEATGGATVRSDSVRTPVTDALTKVAALPGIASVVSPYSPRGAAQISKDGTIAFADVSWKMKAADVTKSDARKLIDAAETAEGPNVRISLGGQSISNEENAGPGLSVAVGAVAALVILLIVFGGALLASLMPLVTAAVALLIGTSVISLLSHVMDTPSVSSDLAVLIGLGVGIDYGLFIISRHRSAVKSGLPYGKATEQAVNTSGRTVLFAGITVCIALLGQFALGIDFLYGLSAASALTVALTMASSLTFLPAMLGFLGPKTLSRRERRAHKEKGPVADDAHGFWLRWASLVERRRVPVALGALVLVVVVALPLFWLRLGSSGAANDPIGSHTQRAYTTLAKGFGPGYNGPFQLVSEINSPNDTQAFAAFLAAAAKTPGVVSVTPPTTSPNGKVALAILYPSTGPGSARTVTLVGTIRDLAPKAEGPGHPPVHVGGETPTNIDFSRVLSEKLPLFIAVVVILAFLLLMAVFRSLLIPLVAAVMNLLSVGAALGALCAVFTWGWGLSVLHVPVAGPVDAFIPVLLFSVLFGLSMDYEVYLVSRMQEEWRHRRGAPAHDIPTHDADRAGQAHRAGEPPSDRVRGDHPPADPVRSNHPPADPVRSNHLAVTHGQAKTGRVIAAAAGIMILVFGSFLIGDDHVLQEFGFGLAFAVLVDALIIRGLLVPALMHLIGPANWFMPAWLRRIVPNLSVEAARTGGH
ncbi:MMPL family transporter [Streptomyces sp. NBC_01498]|uniref:MMPL family transporter n=1 Tax=Streptomyces sp. NBC_01498 TaxID=2975870 RepID=UPI002E7B5D9B|nr:MMPL family transporter [Streptomyces sp. NBC_01498]WTL25705.1 MMPL family transporter [Streptomyces sp. NBC_01498]